MRIAGRCKFYLRRGRHESIKYCTGHRIKATLTHTNSSNGRLEWVQELASCWNRHTASSINWCLQIDARPIYYKKSACLCRFADMFMLHCMYTATVAQLLSATIVYHHLPRLSWDNAKSRSRSWHTWLATANGYRYLLVYTVQYLSF